MTEDVAAPSIIIGHSYYHGVNVSRDRGRSRETAGRRVNNLQTELPRCYEINGFSTGLFIASRVALIYEFIHELFLSGRKEFQRVGSDQGVRLVCDSV